MDAKKAPIWPLALVLDAKGRVRYSHFGEGDYAEQEQVIQGLLEEAKIAEVAVPSAIQTVGR
ncbi:hypothetical protein [Pseudomonas fluorescens]|uniref:hypothetical protein n=1 Tax=Pseudomonas TaxID=286 RepID=UPI003D07C8E9